MFDTLKQQPSDSILRLIGMFRDDPRPAKIDLGVGVYRDEYGTTPVFRAVKEAERDLLETQASKAYLGPEGNARFLELIGPIIFGAKAAGSDRVAGMQTPGGGGALRLAAELIAAANPKATVWLGTPTWPNHAPIMAVAGLQVATYQWFDPETQTAHFQGMVDALSTAQPGDVVLLHGCCHNPTGADLTAEQWRYLAEFLGQRGLIPFIDLAYQGLGDGLEADALGLRTVLGAVDEAIVAYSCNKNFGLYRERCGALFVKARTAQELAVTCGNMASLIRVNWSMPPDHGAAVVSAVLDNPSLKALWLDELQTMRDRLKEVREGLVGQHPMLRSMSALNGLFAQLPLSLDAVLRLRKDYGIYMLDSARINVAGLRMNQIGYFSSALADVSDLRVPA